MKRVVATFAVLALLALPSRVLAQDDDATDALMHKLDAFKQLYVQESLAAEMRYNECSQVCTTRQSQCTANSRPEGQCVAELADCRQTCAAANTADRAAAAARYNASLTIHH